MRRVAGLIPLDMSIVMVQVMLVVSTSVEIEKCDRVLQTYVMNTIVPQGMADFDRYPRVRPDLTVIPPGLDRV